VHDRHHPPHAAGAAEEGCALALAEQRHRQRHADGAPMRRTSCTKLLPAPSMAGDRAASAAPVVIVPHMPLPNPMITDGPSP
jgi:hypothetical protein